MSAEHSAAIAKIINDIGIVIGDAFAGSCIAGHFSKRLLD
jgi:hypothetical protein